MSRILQDRLPDDAIAHPLPGTRPMAPGDWLRRDERFAQQMALRDALIAERRAEVVAARPEADRPVRELLGLVCHAVGSGATAFARPDGVTVPIDAGDPLATLGRLCQEDFAVMLPGEDEHYMAAGVICFPSRWRLAQKIGRPLTRIHRPVAVYDAAMAHRVQRLFDGVRAGQPIVRWNRLPYWSDDLFNPQSEPAPGAPRAPEGTRAFVRVERQVILRLPDTGAVVFSIHTWLVRAPAGADSDGARHAFGG